MLVYNRTFFGRKSIRLSLKFTLANIWILKWWIGSSQKISTWKVTEPIEPIHVTVVRHFAWNCQKFFPLYRIKKCFTYKYFRDIVVYYNTFLVTIFFCVVLYHIVNLLTRWSVCFRIVSQWKPRGAEKNYNII